MNVRVIRQPVEDYVLFRCYCSRTGKCMQFFLKHSGYVNFETQVTVAWAEWIFKKQKTQFKNHKPFLPSLPLCIS